MLEERLTQDELKKVAKLAQCGKKIALIQGRGSDDVRTCHTIRKRYFRLGFLEFECETGINYQGDANLTIKSRGREVLDVSWQGSYIRTNQIHIHEYKPRPEWKNLVFEWGQKNKPEAYVILIR
jgi:hypothetical protein